MKPLKPCPLCGSEPLDLPACIWCQKCGIKLDSSFYPTPAEQRNVWNRRSLYRCRCELIGAVAGLLIGAICNYFIGKQMYDHAVMVFILGISLVHLTVYRFS